MLIKFTYSSPYDPNKDIHIEVTDTDYIIRVPRDILSMDIVPVIEDAIKRSFVLYE